MVEQNRSGTTFNDLEDVIFVENRFAFEENFAAFDRRYFSRCFVHEVFGARLRHATGQLATDGFLKIGFIDLHLFGQAE